MKLQYCSDLHLEFPENREFIKANPLQAKGDVLVLADDIMLFADMDKHNAFSMSFLICLRPFIGFLAIMNIIIMMRQRRAGC